MISKSEMQEMVVYLEKEASTGWRTEIAKMAGVSQSTAWAVMQGNTGNQKVAEAVKTMYERYVPLINRFEEASKAFEENGPSYILHPPTAVVHITDFRLLLFNSTKGPVIVQLIAYSDKYRIFLNEEGFNQTE